MSTGCTTRRPPADGSGRSVRARQRRTGHHAATLGCAVEVNWAAWARSRSGLSASFSSLEDQQPVADGDGDHVAGKAEHSAVVARVTFGQRSLTRSVCNAGPDMGVRSDLPRHRADVRRVDHRDLRGGPRGDGPDGFRGELAALQAVAGVDTPASQAKCGARRGRAAGGVDRPR